MSDETVDPRSSPARISESAAEVKWLLGKGIILAHDLHEAEAEVKWLRALVGEAYAHIASCGTSNDLTDRLRRALEGTQR